MGQIFAVREGEKTAVSKAIAEHYRPDFAGDVLPENIQGKILPTFFYPAEICPGGYWVLLWLPLPFLQIRLI